MKKSIKESVHKLLEDQITRLGLQAYYEVQKAEILGRRTQKTSFTFHICATRACITASPWRARISCESRKRSDFIQGSQQSLITYASFSPSPMFTALTAYPGTVVRRLYRQGAVFAIS